MAPLIVHMLFMLLACAVLAAVLALLPVRAGILGLVFQGVGGMLAFSVLLSTNGHLFVWTTAVVFPVDCCRFLASCSSSPSRPGGGPPLRWWVNSPEGSHWC